MTVRIAIVNSSSFGKHFPEHMEALNKVGQVDYFNFPINISGKELAENLTGYSIIIASVTPFYTKDFFEHKDETLLITRHGIGYNNIDITSADAHGVIVTKVEGIVEQEAVAENAVALLMTLIRRVKDASNIVLENNWKHRANYMGYEVKNKVVGVIGLGNIGSRVGEILKNGFEAELIAYDLKLSPEEIINRGAEPVSLEELLKRSDIISLNAALSSDNYHMLGEKDFKLMKKGVIIINTARGELLDLDPLVEALEDGTIWALGMDVVEGEPIDNNHPLLQYSNVIITPHTSAYTYECLKGMGDKVVDDVLKVLNNEIPNCMVSSGVFTFKEGINE